MKNTSVAAFVEQAIAKRGKRLISVPALVSELRSAKPDCEHTDDELSHLITVIAISKGCNLSFMRPKGFDAVDW
ncbi:hypothetical protein [Mesorhizobium sp. CAU 1741]|uniref:hypothetical protein n=1 Tax=Mesorhizobium sp. CAU 1741 TaxID=3140366 RepID=UPI00325AF0EC